MAYRLLVVEDDPGVTKVLRLALEAEGYTVIGIEDGQEAIAVVERERPHLIVLDRRLPRLDGVEICRRLRARSDVPILMLTGVADEAEKLVGLAVGADDYVTKPFSPREVVARVGAILRRGERSAERTLLRRGELEMDLERQEFFLAGREVPLTPHEFKLLRIFLRSPGRVFSREELLNQIYPHRERAVVDRTVDVLITGLRKKLADDPQHPRFIITARGVGYKLL